MSFVEEALVLRNKASSSAAGTKVITSEVLKHDDVQVMLGIVRHGGRCWGQGRGGGGGRKATTMTLHWFERFW